MQIWPAIDIRNGNCVRLVQGDYQQETVYGADPAAMALEFQSQGATGLHLVDLDGARDGTTPNEEPIKAIVNAVSIPCQLGGGIRSEDTIRKYIDLGIKRLLIGTRAVTDPAWFQSMCQLFPEYLLAAIDARDGLVSIEGWKTTSGTRAVDLAVELSKHPVGGIVYTDIARDGMLQGPNTQAMKEMADAVAIPVIASGGVTTQEDIKALARCGVQGCVVGRALYEGQLTLQQALAVAEVAPG